MGFDLVKLNKLQAEKDQREAETRAKIKTEVDKSFAEFQEYLDSDEFSETMYATMEHYLTGASENASIVIGVNERDKEWRLIVQFGKVSTVMVDFHKCLRGFDLEAVEKSGQDVVEVAEPFRVALIDRVQSLGLKIRVTKARYESFIPMLIFVFDTSVK